MNTGLELATVEELLTELFGRSTFAGVLVFSPEDHKFPGQDHSVKMITSVSRYDATKFIEIANNLLTTEE